MKISEQVYQTLRHQLNAFQRLIAEGVRVCQVALQTQCDVDSV